MTKKKGGSLEEDGHNRTPFFGATEEFYTHLARVFSEASTVYDARIQSNFVNRTIRDIEIHTILKYVHGADCVLEIGCGTGEEARRVIFETGKKVEAIDISEDMIAYASSKAAGSGIGDKFSAKVMAAMSVGSISRQFKLIYSLNGVLNTEPAITEFFSGIQKITESGSTLIFSFRNRFCLGESLILAITGKRRKISERRSECVPVEVVGKTVMSRYYGVKEFLNLVPQDFNVQEKLGLAVFLPPYMAERIHGRLLMYIISIAERLFCRLPLFNRSGDEVLYVLRKK